MSESGKNSVSQNETADELFECLSKVSLDERELSSQIQTIGQQLKTLECPFTWASQTPYMKGEDISKLEEKSTELQGEEYGEDLPWMTFVLNLVLCYEYHSKGCISDALTKQVECEKILNSKPNGDARRAAGISSVGLWHVCLACKCFVQFRSGQYIQVEQTLAKIRLPVQMSEREQASLWGCRAAFFMEYGISGNRQAIDHVERALQLDPQQGEWHFLLGQALCKIRGVDNFDSIPERKEFDALENAVKLTDSLNHKIFLARVCRETAFRRTHLKPEDRNKFKIKLASLNNRSVELYRTVLKLKKDSCYINILCAQAFLKLPWPYRDVALAKECIDRALSISPNNGAAHHVAAKYFEQYREDLERAKEHYTLAGENGVYGAWLDLFRVKYLQDDHYDPVPDLEWLLEQHQDPSRQQQTLCQLGSFYFFVKSDLKTALGYWQRAMELDPKSIIFQRQLCRFINMKKPVNIHELVIDEARLIIQSNSGSADDLAMWHKVVSDYAASHPQLCREPPMSRRKMVLAEVMRNQQYDFSRGRSRWHY